MSFVIGYFYFLSNNDSVILEMIYFLDLLNRTMIYTGNFFKGIPRFYTIDFLRSRLEEGCFDCF